MIKHKNKKVLQEAMPSLKTLVVFFLIMSLFMGCIENQENNQHQQTTSNVLLIIPPVNHDIEELQAIQQHLQTVDVKSRTATRVDREDGNTTEELKVDFHITEDIGFTLSDYDALIFIGGPGASLYHEDPVIHKIIKKALEINIILGAMGTAPLIIVKAIPDFITGKTLTGDPSVINSITTQGAHYGGDGVSVDTPFVTASGEDYATPFINEIMRLLEPVPR